jgi:photosystem II stability/assembly factor-like uncharacterized protein
LGSGVVLAGSGSNAGSGGSNGKVWKSTDGGYAWKLVLNATNEDICTVLYETSTGRILAGFRDNGGIYYSDDDGDTWTASSVPSGTLIIADFVEFTNEGLDKVILASGGDGSGLFHQSTDDGATWSFYIRLSESYSTCLELLDDSTDTILAGVGNHGNQGRVYRGGYRSISAVNTVKLTDILSGGLMIAIAFASFVMGIRFIMKGRRTSKSKINEPIQAMN